MTDNLPLWHRRPVATNERHSMQPLTYDDILTDHWHVSELCRPDDWPLLAADEHLQMHLQALATTVLEPLRVLAGHPLICISGYRSPAHNVSINGAKQSQHMLANAADIVPEGVDWAALRGHFLGNTGYEEFTAKMAGDQEMIRQLDLLVEHHLGSELQAVGGVGLYLQSGWVHVDRRARGPNGHVARWTGNDFGSEQ
jgi:Peptidase M15